MVPRSYRIKYTENCLLITKTTRKFLDVFEVFEKTRGISKLPHSYFLYVGVPRWVTKLFRIEEENMRCAEVQVGGNCLTKIRYFLGSSAFLPIIIQLRQKTINFGGKHIFSETNSRPHKKHMRWTMYLGMIAWRLKRCRTSVPSFLRLSRSEISSMFQKTMVSVFVMCESLS